MGEVVLGEAHRVTGACSHLGQGKEPCRRAPALCLLRSLSLESRFRVRASQLCGSALVPPKAPEFVAS